MIEDRMPSLPVLFCELCWEPGSGRRDVDEPEAKSAVSTDSTYLSGYDHRGNHGVCTVCHLPTQIWRHARIKWFAKRRVRRTEDDSPSDRSQSSRPSSRITLSQDGTQEPTAGDCESSCPKSPSPRSRHPSSSSEGSWDRINQSTHRYRCLAPGNIRLLVLSPGRVNEPIECFLDHYPLQDCPNYTALSYTWGSPGASVLIYLDGASFWVRLNLYFFLEGYRDRYNPSVLWIDAVCINQDDLDEKTSQIQLMNRIYEEADHVLIWLGEDSDCTFTA